MPQSVLNLFFPMICSGCQSILHTHEKVLCTHCRHELPLTKQHLTENNPFYNKFYGKIPLEHASALLDYHKKGIVQQLIHQLKYKGHEEIGKFIGEWYGTELLSVLSLQTVNCIIPVPLHPKKIRERGYNQVSSFGKALSKVMQVPYREDLLIRTAYSKTQTSKNIVLRTDLKKELFEIKAVSLPPAPHFLLIDDVITTGSTLEACAKVLLKIPESKLSMVCMAMSQS